MSSVSGGAPPETDVLWQGQHAPFWGYLPHFMAQDDLIKCPSMPFLLVQIYIKLRSFFPYQFNNAEIMVPFKLQVLIF